MDNYEFRLADSSEVAEILRVYHRIIGTPGCTWSEEYPNRDTVESDIAANALYMLKEGDEIIAVAASGYVPEYGWLKWSVPNPCELARIGVVPERQGHGIGSLILEKVIAEMKVKGFGGMRFLVSKTNPAALTMYGKFGFQECGEIYIYDHYYFCYELPF